MTPFMMACQGVLSDLRLEIITLCKKYFSGDSTTGRYGQFREHLGKIAGTSINTLNAGITTLQDITGIDGAMRIYSSAGTVGTATLTVLPNVKIGTVFVTSSNLVLPILLPPAITIGTTSINPYSLQPMITDASTGKVTSWQAEVPINGSFSSQTIISATGSVTDISCTYQQPQSLGTQGVS